MVIKIGRKFYQIEKVGNLWQAIRAYKSGRFKILGVVETKEAALAKVTLDAADAIQDK